jgi:hypothetical protein
LPVRLPEVPAAPEAKVMAMTRHATLAGCLAVVAVATTVGFGAATLLGLLGLLGWCCNRTVLCWTAAVLAPLCAVVGGKVGGS